MDKETLRKVQLVQLEIAKEIKRVCNKYDIKYFLDSGTLLGAVRHKGFIPWDDDLDIGMLREEYEKFLEIAPRELSSQYFLQTWDNDSVYPLAFAKIRKKGTIYLEEGAGKNQTHNELYVDILPYDVYPSKKLQRIWQGFWIELYKHQMLLKAKATPWKHYPGSKVAKFVNKMKYALLSLLTLFISRPLIKKYYKKIMVRHNCFPTKEVYEQTGASRYGKWVIPMECFTKYVQLPFEDDTFSCPADADLYLKCAYGDYMKLPPEDKRENRHGIIEIKL